LGVEAKGGALLNFMSLQKRHSQFGEGEALAEDTIGARENSLKIGGH
jgi:hypothetical protein